MKIIVVISKNLNKKTDARVSKCLNLGRYTYETFAQCVKHKIARNSSVMQENIAIPHLKKILIAESV